MSQIQNNCLSNSVNQEDINEIWNIKEEDQGSFNDENLSHEDMN